ncbi:MAG: hypothetical protein JXA68_00475, partial [Ignavibacteriales bacterium]|nr:hypothetical protein [Ignavibacteriales bacterium]
TTNYASKTGNVYSVETAFIDYGKTAEFNTTLNDKIYCVEAPDGINPVKESKTLLRYSENNISAAVGYKDKYGIVVFGFPFETIIDLNERNIMMKSIIDFLNVQ